MDIKCDWTVTTQSAYIFSDSLNGDDTFPTLRKSSAKNGSFTYHRGLICLRDKLNLTVIRVDDQMQRELTEESNRPQLTIFIPTDSYERVHKVVVTTSLEQIQPILNAIRSNQTGFELNQFWSHWENNCSRVPLGSIRHLDLSHCGLDNSQLGRVDLGRLANLRSLKLDYNDIGNWPTQNLCGKKLRKVSLRHTQLREIPDWFGQSLPKLKLLDVSHNQLTSLPSCLAQLSCLEKFKIGHNQLSLMPLSLAKQILHNNGKCKYFAQHNRLSQDNYIKRQVDLLNDPLPTPSLSSLQLLALNSTRMSFKQLKRATNEQLAVSMTKGFQVCPVCNQFFQDGCETLTFGMVKSQFELHFKGLTCSSECRYKAVVYGITAN